MYRARKIESWLNKIIVVKCVINEDITVDVDFNINLINGFDFNWNNLNNLTGYPQIVYNLFLKKV